MGLEGAGFVKECQMTAILKAAALARAVNLPKAVATAFGSEEMASQHFGMPDFRLTYSWEAIALYWER
jgi:hypothetical protein